MDGVLLKKLIQLVEEERQDKKLLKLLEHTVEGISFSSGIIEVNFKNGEKCRISSNLNDYSIAIGDSLFYQSGDNEDSKMSIDRIMFYLDILGQYKYE
jgi:hypothetical protein